MHRARPLNGRGYGPTDGGERHIAKHASLPGRRGLQPAARRVSERAKQLQIAAGTDRVYSLARKYKLKIAFGTDILFSPQLASRQGTQLPKLTRWYSASEILNQATAANGELLRLSGLRNPYSGNLGLVEEGALADLILVDGNPLENIDLSQTPIATSL